MSVSLGPSGLTMASRNTSLFANPVLLYSNSAFTLTTTAQDVFAQRTSVSGDDAGLSTGPHLLEIYVSSNPYYSMGYSGIMQWFGSETNDGDVDDIFLHSSGHAANNTQLYARTRMVSRSANTDLRFQLWSNSTGATTVNISVYAKRFM